MGPVVPWNGIIVWREHISQEEVDALKRIGIHEVEPDWPNLFRGIRADRQSRQGDPYCVSPLIIHVCECLAFATEVYRRTGLEVEDILIDECGLALDIPDLATGDLVLVHDPRLQHFMGSLVDHVGVITDTGTVVHAQRKNELWEGSMEDFLRNGRFRIGRRLIGRDGLATFALGERGSDVTGFSPENVNLLRSYL